MPQTDSDILQNGAAGTNGASTLHDLFALTDEQILEIVPEAQDVEVTRSGRPTDHEQKRDGVNAASAERTGDAEANGAVGEKSASESQRTPNRSAAEHEARSTDQIALEPPQWLAAQMKDPWNGEAARELWNDAQQAKQDAAAYRAAIASPEEAKELKELYPGGVSEARATATRARMLDDIDRAFFGAPGSSSEQTTASRSQLAEMMLREDPAAFREMVFAGLKVLEKNGAAAASQPVGAATHATPAVPAAITAEQEVLMGRYAAFERAANEDLERSVGNAIEKTITQALPTLGRNSATGQRDSRSGQPLQAKLNAAVRQDVETALKADRQLGEQMAQILSSRRFDDQTRAQVVRLIGERAQQLVPDAARRVINEWTQTTLSAHRGQTGRVEATSTRREVSPASPRSGAGNTSSRDPRAEPRTDATRSRNIDYRRLSDEQILDL